jgi:hypothetical protein
MRDVTGLMDVEVEALMKQARGDDQDQYADVIRRRQISRTLPFDARNEVSADATYIAGRIVTHMWIIGVLVPVVAVLLVQLLAALK